MKKNRSAVKRKTSAVLSIMLMLLLLTSCFSNVHDPGSDAVAKGWEEKFGTGPELINAVEYNDKMSESHRIMAAMILSRNGMDSDLDSYKHVCLYMVTTVEGEEKAVVVADDTYIYPD